MMQRCLVDVHHVDINQITVDRSFSTDAWWWNLDHEGKLVIPEGVQHVNKDMFYNRRDIRSISVPNGVKSIEDSAFCICTNLEKITLPDSINYIAPDAFSTCDSDKLVYHVPSDSMKSYLMNRLHIDDNKIIVEQARSTNAWHWNVIDGQVIVPDNMKFIYDYMLYGRNDVKSVIMNNNIEKLGKYAFRNSGLVSIEIPSSVKSIDNLTFSGCSDLKSITLSNNIERIEERAFFSCKSLQNINVKEEIGYMYVESKKNNILQMIGALKKAGREYFSGQVQVNFIRNDGTVFESYKYNEARKEWAKQK